MINAGILLAGSRGLIFGGPEIALWLTGKSLASHELHAPLPRISIVLATRIVIVTRIGIVTRFAIVTSIVYVVWIVVIICLLLLL